MPGKVDQGGQPGRIPDQATTAGSGQAIFGTWRLWPGMVILAAYVLNLGIHGLLGTYSRFIADDYCSAGIAGRFGILRAVWYWYLNWTGRYAASALDATFGLLGPGVTPFVPALVLVTWVAVVACALVLAGMRESRRQLAAAVVLAVALVCTTLELSPNVPQSLYWGQGMRSIIAPLIISALYVDLLLWYRRGGTGALTRKILLVVGSVLAFFMGGLNETFTALEVSGLAFALLLILCLGKWRSWRPLRDFLLGGVLAAAIAFAVVVSAPGNAFRQAYYPPPPGLVGILSISLLNFGAYWGWLLGSVEHCVAAAAAALLAGYAGLRRPTRSASWWQAAGLLVIGLAFSYLCFLPAAYGLSDAPPDRTLLIPAFVLALTLMLAAYATALRIGQNFQGSRRPAGLEVSVLALAVAAALATTSWADARLLASQALMSRYAAHWDSTNAQIIAARSAGQSEVWITSMQNWAGLNEPNDNPKFWVNVCYEEYYGIRVLAEGQP